ncbi:MAG TPA: MlaD family protein [Bacteroidia bacterium]|nr:MlaD family protein [Bacteroidia bacterium]
MKLRKPNNIKLGLFVIIGCLLLIAGIYIIGSQKNLFGSNFRLKVYFSTIEGLMVGNNVRFSGIDVGVVDDIVIQNDTTIEVTLLIQEKVRKFIKKDSKATIGTNGLMGDRVVNLLPGSMEGKPVDKDATIPSIKPFTMDDIIDPILETAENAKMISQDLAEISNNIRNGKGTIGRLFTDEEMAQNVNNTLKNVNAASEKLDENMNALQDNFLFRRYYKKKAKEAERKRKQQEEEEEEEEEEGMSRKEKREKRKKEREEKNK